MSYLVTICLSGLCLLFGSTLGKDPIEVAMEKVSNGYEMACLWNNNISDICQNLHEELQEKVLGKFYFKRKPERREPYFQQQSKKLLVFLTEDYQQKCGSYLNDPNSKTAVDEGEVLKDNGIDYPFKGYAHCLVNVLRDISGSRGILIPKPDEVELGIENSIDAYQFACRGQSLPCDGRMISVRYIMFDTPFCHGPRGRMRCFGIHSIDAVKLLPGNYAQRCLNFLSDPYADPPADERANDYFDDAQENYPYKAYAHCVVQVRYEVEDELKKLKENFTMFYYGIDKVEQAYTMACEFNYELEYIEGKHCVSHFARALKNSDEFEDPMKAFKYFQTERIKDLEHTLSSVYKDHCLKFVSDPETQPPADESLILDDVGKDYPFKAFAHCLLDVLRRESNGTMKPDCSILHYGMEKSVQAYEMACAYADDYSTCENWQRDIVNNIISDDSMKDNARQQLDKFRVSTSWNALRNLPLTYYKKCIQFVNKPFQPPTVDESNELQDEGKMYPFKGYAHCLLHTLREISSGEMRKNWSMLNYGMEKAVKAYEMACAYADVLVACEGEQRIIMNNILSDDKIKDKGRKQLEDFRKYSPDHALKKLPQAYFEKCSEYLEKPLQPPSADESNELQDEGQMYPFKGYAHCLLHTLREISGGEMRRTWSKLYYGMEKAVQAFDMACTYEPTNNCEGKQLWMMSVMLERDDLKNRTQVQMNAFRDWTKSLVLPTLPKLYQENCEKYLSGEKTFKIDEGMELKDEGRNYYFKAYSHCLVHTLREISGGTMKRET